MDTLYRSSRRDTFGSNLRTTFSTSYKDCQEAELESHKWSLSTAWKSVAINRFMKDHVLDQVRKVLPPVKACQNFPYKQDRVNEWSTENIPSPQNPGTTRTINILNTTYKHTDIKNYPTTKDIDLSKLEEDGSQILFHGTNHESAKDIIENGIRLNKLKKKRPQDFSCGRGFYMNGELHGKNGAEEWAFHRHDEKQAVLIFKVPNRDIELYKQKSKRFDNDQELIEFAQKFRLRDGPPTQELESKLVDLTFVEGPRVKVLKDEKGRPRSVEPIKETYQICLLSDDLANLFNQYLHAVIFFKLPQKKERHTSGLPEVH